MPNDASTRPKKKTKASSQRSAKTRDVASLVRDTQVRGTIPSAVRYALWGKNAGRCTLCNHRLLAESKTFLHSINAAELAHIVGATTTAGSPRGLEAHDDPDFDTESEENLLLCCHECHKVIDDDDHIAHYTPQKLRALKEEHERFVEMVTADGRLARTAVIRIGSDVRGTPTIASRREVSETLLANNLLGLVESERTGEFKCAIPGEATDTGYWEMARSQLARTLRNVRQAIADGEAAHLSVFAIAPIPVLVMLGAELDDKVETRLFQKRHTGGWDWSPDADPVSFAHESTVPGPSDSEDVVLICSLSAEVEPSRLPTHLADTPALTLRPVEVEPSAVVFKTEQSLTNYRDAFRIMLADAERMYPHARRWHLVGAMGVTAAIESGRAFMREAQPPVAVYQRHGNGSYEAVLTINDPGSPTAPTGPAAIAATGGRP